MTSAIASSVLSWKGTPSFLANSSPMVRPPEPNSRLMVMANGSFGIHIVVCYKMFVLIDNGCHQVCHEGRGDDGYQSGHHKRVVQQILADDRSARSVEVHRGDV